EAAADLVIEPDLLVPLQRSLHQRLQDLVAVLIRDPPLGDDRYDIVREPLDKLNHRSLLVLPPTAPREAARPPSSRTARFVCVEMIRSGTSSSFAASRRRLSGSTRRRGGPRHPRHRCRQTPPGSRSGWRARGSAPCSPRRGPQRR